MSVQVVKKAMEKQVSDDFIGLGIAGNWRGHLDQINGSAEYSRVATADKLAPKGLFPWYVKNAPGKLGVNPVSSSSLLIPGGIDVHPEPELVLECKIVYDKSIVANVIPQAFSVFNDASVRNSSESVTAKKNFGGKTKGLCSTFVPLSRFDASCDLEHFTIASWLKRDGSWNMYSEFCHVRDYEYFYDELIAWLVDTLNSQPKSGPLENMRELLHTAGMPEKALISLGATRYTQYGVNNYISAGDEYVIALFDNRDFAKSEITKGIQGDTLKTSKKCLILRQELLAK